MARIFISSTTLDLREYREAAVRALSDLGHDAIGLERFGASDRLPIVQSLTGIATSDLYIGIFGPQYGPVPPADNPDSLSVIETEYQYALQLGKPALFFMWDGIVQSSSIDVESMHRMQMFREKVLSHRLVSLFDSVEGFERQLRAAVLQWDRERLTQSVVFANLPLAWRFVVDFKAEPDLLRHLDPGAFATALERWEEENRADRNLALAGRLKTALDGLESKQSGRTPSELWLAWMRATRPSGVEPTAPGQTANEP